MTHADLPDAGQHSHFQIDMHIRDADAHAIAANNIGDDAQTLLPSGAITSIFNALYVVHAITAGTGQGGIATLELDDSAVIFEDGANTCTLAITAGGALTVVAAGTDTYNLKLLPLWL